MNKEQGAGSNEDGIMQNIIIETDDERGLSIDELRRKCLIYAQQNFQGKSFINKDTGRVIQVSHQGLGEWKMKSKTREQILSIKILDKLLENIKIEPHSGTAPTLSD